MSGKSRVIVVGGVAGGASTAARLRRLSESAEITIYEKGGYVSFANCGLPYYLGGEIKQWEKLQVTTPQQLHDKFNLSVHTRHEVVGIDRASKKVSVKQLDSGETIEKEYDHLVLAVGCEAIIPRAIPGIARAGHFALRSLEDTTAIEQWMALHHPRRVVVCGGGFIGLEIAEQLKERNLQVAIVEAVDQVMAPLDKELAECLHTELRGRGIELYLSNPVDSFEEPGAAAAASNVRLKDGACLPADMVILALGVRPLTGLAKDAGIELTQRGHVKVNERMQTLTDPCVWAVGDAVEVPNRALGGGATWAVALGGPANRQGRVCADNLAGKANPSTYKGTMGSSVVKVFSLTAASVGANEKMLRGMGKEHKAVYLHPNQHAGYYPGATPVHLKLLFDRATGQIFGAQAVGKDGVEKRIDVIATAMHSGMKADELADIELCYAPPYGSARDPVNYAGMIAGNIMEGFMDQITPDELRCALEADSALRVLDVRGAKEIVEQGSLHGVPEGRLLNIPLGELRPRMEELRQWLQGPGTSLVVSCKTGQRAHVAACMLQQCGFEGCRVLSGSWTTDDMVKRARSA